MKRGTFMLAKERTKLSKLVKTYLCLRNAVVDPTGFYQYKIKTKAGILLVSFGKSQGAIFCRFEDPEKALRAMPDYENQLRLNRYSGKWNWHFGKVSAEEAFYAFKNGYERIQRHVPEIPRAKKEGGASGSRG